jgi:hypothetical protein
LTSVIEVSGTEAPEVSVTVPVMPPRVCCECNSGLNAKEAKQINIALQKKYDFELFIMPCFLLK